MDFDEAIAIEILFGDETEENGDGDLSLSSVKSVDKKYEKNDILRLVAGDDKRLTYNDISLPSAIYTKFKQIEIDGRKVNFVACNVCRTIYSWTKSKGNHSLHRHVCETSKIVRGPNKPLSTIDRYTRKFVPQAAKSKLNKNITFGLVKDMRPLFCVEGTGFQHFAQALINFGAQYGYQDLKDCVANRTTLKRTYVPELVSDVRQHYKGILSSAPPNYKFAFSKDMWSEKYNQRQFLSVTAHFITDDWELLAMTLGLHEVSEQKTTENLRRTFAEMMRPYFDDSRVAEIFDNGISVTDGGSNMIDIFRNHRPCQCHKLNLFVDWTLNQRNLPTQEEIAKKAARGKSFPPKKLFNLQTHCPTIKKTLDGVKSLVEYYKQSARNAKLPTTLKQDVNTRWDSELIMLESYAAVRPDVEAMLLETRQFNRLVDIDNELVNELIEFLNPIRKCSRSLSGEKYPTIHLVSSAYAWLKTEIRIKETDSHEIVLLKQQAELCFAEYLTVDSFYLMATMLNPKFRQLRFVSPELRGTATDFLKMLVDEQCSSSNDVIIAVPEKGPTPKPINSFSQFEDVTVAEIGVSEQLYLSEVDKYLLQSFNLNAYTNEEGHLDILRFWKECNDFPNVKKVARYILAVPASETADERNFSSSGQVLIPRRTQISGSSLNEFVFLHKSLIQPNL